MDLSTYERRTQERQEFSRRAMERLDQPYLGNPWTMLPADFVQDAVSRCSNNAEEPELHKAIADALRMGGLDDSWVSRLRLQEPTPRTVRAHLDGALVSPPWRTGFRAEGSSWSNKRTREQREAEDEFEADAPSEFLEDFFGDVCRDVSFLRFRAIAKLRQTVKYSVYELYTGSYEYSFQVLSVADIFQEMQRD